jgi:hypothetical protein
MQVTVFTISSPPIPGTAPSLICSCGSSQGLAWFAADEFGVLLEELAHKGVLQQRLQPGERGTCMQTDVPIVDPSARGAMDSSATEGCEKGMLTAMFEFEPYQMPGGTTPNAVSLHIILFAP